MSVGALIGGGLSIGGGLLSGYGAAEANKSNKESKMRLGNEIGNLQTLSQPVYDALIPGLQPGGLYSQATAAGQNADALSQYGQQRTQIGGNAWRYGGGRAGRTQGLLRSARGGLYDTQASSMSGADIQGSGLLSRLYATARGYDKAFPETPAGNRYAEIAQGLGALGQSFQGDAGEF